MSEAQFYDNGLDRLGAGHFVAVTFQFMVVSGYTFDPTDHFVSDVVADELAGSGYARATATTKTRTPDTTNHKIVYDADDPAFGSIVAGETGDGMILYEFITNDAASILVAYYPMSKATDGNPYTVVLASSGLAVIRNPP